MPLYEYRCAKCGRTFEEIQKVTHKRKAKCPECGGAAQRLPSAPAIHFKGTGWYITDYARKGQTDDAKKDDAPKADFAKDKDGAAAESPAKEAAKDSGSKGAASKKAKKKA